LGEEGFRHLERCRTLIYRDGNGQEMPSRGQLVRLALQRLLLCLLREEIEWDRSRKDLIAEYSTERVSAGLMDPPTPISTPASDVLQENLTPKGSKSTKQKRGAK